MAFFQHGNFLRNLRDPAFEMEHLPSAPAPWPGIYRCTGCGREAIASVGHTLPSQTHHLHGPGEGLIRWRLIVWADHRAVTPHD